MKKNAHCSYCGHAYAVDQAWPRKCLSCGNTTWVNPIPGAVCLLPIDDGLLCVRRAIPPGEGKLALPGGYIDQNETWQQAVARELGVPAGQGTWHLPVAGPRRSGQPEALACASLFDPSPDNGRGLAGGMKAWVQSGFPVVRDDGSPGDVI